MFDVKDPGFKFWIATLAESDPEECIALMFKSDDVKEMILSSTEPEFQEIIEEFTAFAKNMADMSDKDE